MEIRHPMVSYSVLDQPSNGPMERSPTKLTLYSTNDEYRELFIIFLTTNRVMTFFDSKNGGMFLPITNERKN